MTRVLGHNEMEQVARDLNISAEQVERTLVLLEQGNTIPFIARYRRDLTGGLGEEVIRAVEQRVAKRRALEDRKQSILKSITSQGKLSPSLKTAIRRARNTKRLEDLYRPFKPKKQSLAMAARESGLEPLVAELLAASSEPPDQGAGPESLSEKARRFAEGNPHLSSAEAVLEGVVHLLAEQFHEDAELREHLRRVLQQTARLSCTRIRHPEPAASAPSTPHPTPQEEPATANSTGSAADTRPSRSAKKSRHGKIEAAFRQYFDYSEPLQRIKPHRVLAINRGERERVLRVRIDIDPEELFAVARPLAVREGHPYEEFLGKALRDAITRLIFPSLEREFRRELTERAEEHAIDVFARNLRKLLLQPPVRHRPVLAIAPAFKSGCKLAVLDPYGNVQATDLIHLIGNEEKRAAGRTRLVQLLQDHEVTAIAIGNGSACRETEILVADVLAQELANQETAYTIVNEAGASVYSTSELGREELPDHDPVQRSAISIGRRLLDPLSELVKISPAHLGVGMYQHDVKQKHLQEALDAVVESCVNFVGVDVNTASPALLRYVSGLNQLTARRIYEHRLEHGPFRQRSEFPEVPGFGAAAYVQAAGFLKISDGDHPLDATRVHPESYDTAARLLAHLGGDLKQLVRAEIAEQDRPALARELEIGELLLDDLVQWLTQPGRDPREDLPAPTFRRGILKLEDLDEGMELSGTVLNVVDFGAFVDIGLPDSGLIHISRLADCYIRDPHDVVSVGDVLTVWVHEIDKARRRVSLSALDPRQERRSTRGSRSRRSRPSKQTTNSPPASPAAASSEGVTGSASDQVSSGTRRATAGRSQGESPRGGRRRAGSTRRTAARAPAPPLTKAMEEGREPLRSFSDLLQFYSQKPSDPPPQDASNSNQNQANQAAKSSTDEPVEPETPDPPSPPPSQSDGESQP